jgi:CRP-like cAMP-binding protein
MVSDKVLKEFPVFSKLPKTILSRLAKKIQEERHPENAVIFAEGKWGDALYLVAKGEVMIRKTLDEQKGTSKVIAVLGPGEFFGEMALLEDAPRSAAAVAHSPLVLLRLPREEFNALLQKNPRVAMELFRGLVMTLSLRLRQTTREMVAIFEVGRVIAQGGDVRTLASRILFQVRHSFEDDVFAGFFYWNEFTAEFELWATEGRCPGSVQASRLKNDGLVKWLSEKRECLLSVDWPKDDRFSEKDRNAWSGFRSLLAAPVFGAKDLMGVIVFGHGEQPGFFSSGHRQVVAGVSNLVAATFENALWRQEEQARRRLEQAKRYQF